MGPPRNNQPWLVRVLLVGAGPRWASSWIVGFRPVGVACERRRTSGVPSPRLCHRRLWSTVNGGAGPVVGSLPVSSTLTCSTVAFVSGSVTPRVPLQSHLQISIVTIFLTIMWLQNHSYDIWAKYWIKLPPFKLKPTSTPLTVDCNFSDLV